MEPLQWFSGQTHLTWIDFSVLAGMVALMVWIGFHFRSQQTSTNEFFLGGRRIPWWAACLSFVATEISAVTIISVPAVAYSENWQYAQFFIGSALARILIAYLFIPAFYKFNCTTIYEFLGQRFGAQTQVAGSLFFFVTRLMGSGVRLMAASTAIAILLGWHIVPAILLFTLISIIYISTGGIKAGVWASVFQGICIIGGGFATAAFLIHINGGVSAVYHTASAAGRLSLVDLGPSPSDPKFWKTILASPNILWLAILNGVFGSAAAFGTDHDLMQRLLTVETRRESQKTILLTIPGSLTVLLTYLTIGAGLYTFYAQHPGLPLPAKTDGIFPHFINNQMPPLLRGLMLSVIFLASIDSPLASLSASFVTDIYRPHLNKTADEKHYMTVSRICVGCFGMVLALLAYIFSFFDKFLWLAFKIGGVTFGSLLGVFLLGLLTQRRSNRANVLAMTASAAIMATLLVLSEKGVIGLGWSWLVIMGTVLTFAIGWIFGPMLEPVND